jgi:hypothetical protein
LVDDDPEAVEAMIEYFYRNTYGMHSTADHSSMVLHIKVVALADKYMIAPLKLLAYGDFPLRLLNSWNQEDVMCDATREVYAMGDDECAAGLKSDLLDAVGAHSAEMFDESRTSFRAAAFAIPEFLLDVTTKIATKSTKKKPSLPTNRVWYKCPEECCWEYGAVFGIETDVPESFGMSCPLGCSRSMSKAFWKPNIIQS